MQYSATTPQAYLEQLEADWRKDTLSTIRAMLLALSPALKEEIEYKMLAYQLKDRSIFHLNAQKQYVSLYVGNIEKVPDSDELLKGLKRGKGCIRITKGVNLPDTGLGTFIKNVVELYESGGESDC